MLKLEALFSLWSIIVIVATLALFVEAIALIRFFFKHRRPWWRRLLVLLPLSVSAWSFIVVYQYPPAPLIADLIGPPTPPLYLAESSPSLSVVVNDQRLTAICAGVFVLTLVIRRILNARYIASSQYDSNARSFAHLSRGAESDLQITVLQRREVHSSRPLV